MAKPTLEVCFRGPFSAMPGSLYINLLKELAKLNGLYLWTIEYESGFLVNYVGKTIQGFASRFAQHAKWVGSGKDVLDPDYFSLGENWLVENPTPETILKCVAHYRVFVADLDCDELLLLLIEKALIQRFLSVGGKCKEFLGNKQRSRVESPSQPVFVRSESVIHGLGDYVLI